MKKNELQESNIISKDFFTDVCAILKDARKRAYAAINFAIRKIRQFFLVFPIRDSLRPELSIKIRSLFTF